MKSGGGKERGKPLDWFDKVRIKELAFAIRVTGKKKKKKKKKKKGLIKRKIKANQWKEKRQEKKQTSGRLPENQKSLSFFSVVPKAPMKHLGSRHKLNTTKRGGNEKHNTLQINK